MAGEYKVTLVIFSGVPDPVWTVNPEHRYHRKLKIRLHRSAGRKTYRHEHLPHNLGFRGFLLHHPETDHDHEELIVGKETKELQKVLHDTMPDGLIPDALRQKISDAIKNEVVSAHVQDVQGAYHPSKSAGKTATEKIQKYAPELNLPRWNDSDLIRKYNNCYNYANDKITNSFAQPGFASGNPIHLYTQYKVLKASKSDGLLKIDVPDTAPVPEAPKQPNCLVALVVAEDVDYHWYRLDANTNGEWSHKPGTTAATNRDGEGNPIYDPRKAANNPSGPDYKFVSFMHIFTNIIDGPKIPPSRPS